MPPIDGRMQAHIRPRFIELVKLQGPEQMDEVARRFFARKEAEMKQKDPTFKATRKEFLTNFGIDIEKYTGFFMEVGGSPTIRGAYFPSDKVRPILTIKRSRSGKTWKVISHSCSGFFNNPMDRAWVEVDEYEGMLGDVFFDELQENAEKVQEGMKKDAERAARRKRKKAHRVKVRNWVKAKEDLEKKDG
jgi:hypothetical protein